MTIPRTALFRHIGGPCDGTMMPVEVDDDGVPVEMYTVPDFTSPNAAIPPFAAHQSKLLASMYERDEQLGDDGFEYVFLFRITEVIDQNRSRRAA